jgi:outer membrane protein TolC
MKNEAFPYPGVVALRAEMIDRESEMARETTRMRLRDALVAAADAYHVAVHHGEELKLRDEELALADRLVAATKARVATGSSPQAELLSMEIERANAENDRAHAATSLARSRAELNSLLARDVAAPLDLSPHERETPPADAAPVAPLLALARRYAPEIRMARAEAARDAAALKMAERMLSAPPAPGETMVGEPSAAAFGADVAWVERLRERHAALERAAEEAVRATERRVLAANDAMEAQRRMYVVASTTAAPLAAQAVEEQKRLYESGRGGAADLIAAYRRHLDARHDAVAARHDYLRARAELWAAVGARPELVRDADEGGGK